MKEQISMYKGLEKQSSPNASHHQQESAEGEYHAVDIYVQEQSTDHENAARRSSPESLNPPSEEGMQNYIQVSSMKQGSESTKGKQDYPKGSVAL